MADGAAGDAAPHEFRVLASDTLYRGRVISLRRDVVAMPGGGDSVREVVTHPGAVAVVAGGVIYAVTAHGDGRTIGGSL